MVIDCVDADSARHQSYQLSADLVAPAGPVPPPSTSRLVPGFTGDPMTLTLSDLRQRGYPPRPDPQKAPDGYADWLRFVSQPHTLVNPRAVKTPRALPASFPTPGANFNYSGVTINGGAFYSQVFAQFVVPSTTNQLFLQNGITEQAYIWEGIDSLGSIIQAGVNLQVVVSGGPSLFRYSAADYAFIEWLPDLPYQLPNFPVKAGDLLQVWSWIGDSLGDMNPNGRDAWFMLSSTNGWSYQDCIGPDCFIGTTHGQSCLGIVAEWIIEGGCWYPPGSPGLCPQQMPVPDYQSVTMYSNAYDPSYGSHSFNTDQGVNIDFITGYLSSAPNHTDNHILSTATPQTTTGNPILFTFPGPPYFFE